MTMLLNDANDMIARNRKSVATLNAIAERMRAQGVEVNTSAHEDILDGQQERSRFGSLMYFDGAQTAEMPELLKRSREVFLRQSNLIKIKAVRDFEERCARIISRHFPSNPCKEDAK